MKLKIVQDFMDKNTRELYKAGSEVEFKADRAAELLADPRGLVSEVPGDTPQEPETKAEKPEVKAAKKPRRKKSEK
ncbi:MAG: hypothetical protein IIY21_02070 [Clostridiales bacterium]|jgi:hypothetical protein|nr:hypothetical protein [Clostridiales bacterium]MBQ1572775.1 hypothetical protein [Clostridiales bacterium]